LEINKIIQAHNFNLCEIIWA